MNMTKFANITEFDHIMNMTKFANITEFVHMR